MLFSSPCRSGSNGGLMIATIKSGRIRLNKYTNPNEGYAWRAPVLKHHFLVRLTELFVLGRFC